MQKPESCAVQEPIHNEDDPRSHAGAHAAVHINDMFVLRQRSLEAELLAFLAEWNKRNNEILMDACKSFDHSAGAVAGSNEEADLEAETNGLSAVSSVSNRWLLGDAKHRQVAGQYVAHSSSETSVVHTEGPLKRVSSRKRLRAVVFSARVDFFMAILIALNSVFIGVEVEYVARTRLATIPVWLDVVNMSFTIIFALDILFRLCLQGTAFWRCSTERWWNFFDVCVVSSALADLVASKLLKSKGILRVTRILRVLRAVRILRVVRYLKKLQMMVASILYTLQSLFWAATLMLLIMYMASIVFTDGTSQHVLELNSDDWPSYAMRLDHDFGTLGTCTYTLFLSITGGSSWIEHVENLFYIHELYVAVFFAYISVTLFAFLNVVTGCFCEKAFAQAQHNREHAIHEQLSEKQKFMAEFQTIFAEIDQDHDGTVTFAELQQHVHNERLEAYFRHLDLHIDDAWAIFRLLDDDGSGTVPADEFVEGCLKLRGFAKAVDVQNIAHDFRRMQETLSEFMKYADQSFRVIKAATCANLQKTSD
eukprot:TRINITY_DN25850_c0_g2_i1.p1 TRINITY_DN25850_c0_g2~~TRINITY_DN25850_c0_g2_i1.p1  ORF type:complete len:537 (+),score=90.49 TRINITY_DN25850_c0_g2_i1:254-1864(+)